MARTADSLVKAGQTAARQLLDGGIRAGADIADPLTPAFADAFVRALAAGLKKRRRGIFGDVVEGAGRAARSSNAEREHGLVEVLQNADDLGASRVLCQVVDGGMDGRRLRISHDGGRVVAPDVLAMTLAFITRKTDDDGATGKFGVGLGTLSRMAESFTVHSWPYAFTVKSQRLQLVERERSLDGLYETAKPDTLLVLHLQPNYRLDAFERWFAAFEPEALLFLRSVRQLALLDGAGNVTAERVIHERARTAVDLDVDGSSRAAEELVLRAGGASRQWTRLAVVEPVPVGLTRTDKATPRTTPVALAFDHGYREGRFYAGLPLAIPATLPFSVNGQFDTETSRASLLQGEGWNEWLLDRVGALAAAAARHRLATDTAAGWTVVPLMEDVRDVADTWLHDRLVALVDGVHGELRDTALLPLGGGASLADLSFEAAALTDVVSEGDLAALAPDCTPLPRDKRDDAGRWRDVLSALELGMEVDVEAAIEMLAWDDEQLGQRPGTWFVRLAAAALGAGLGLRLQRLPCLLLADGQRLSPDAALKQGLVLSPNTAGDPLGRRLGLIQPLDPAFYVEDGAATEVMEWLRREVGLRTSTTPADTLRALAESDREEPLQLDDDDLKALLAAFRSAPALAEELGKRIGDRVLVDGQSWVGGKPKSQRVRPAEAYLPRTSWAKAAGKTEGLLWLDRHYARLLRATEPRRAGATRSAAMRRGVREPEGQIARRFLMHLGAELGPRLQPRPTNDELWGERASKVSRSQLTDIQREALDPKSAFTGLMDDYLSADLQAVLENIAKDRVPAAQERARALINAMDRAWPRLYAGHEDAIAVNAHYKMKPVGEVPATWRALAAETPWMTNERGHRREPRRLAVKTPTFEAFLRDAPHKFAFGLDARHASLPVIRALGFEAEPKAVTLIDRLEELREQELAGKRIDTAAVEQCYVTLATMSPDPDSHGPARRMGGETINGVRRRFTRGRLVRASDEWVAPPGVFIGKPIFHRHRRFVPQTAERLWRLLDMRRPDIRDCIDVLEHVAQLGPPEGEQPVLIETYRHVNDELEGEAPPPRALRRLPLWTNDGWVSERPIYAVRDRTLQDAVGKHVPVWVAPVPVGTIEPLLAALDVTLLDDTSFQAVGINSGSRSAGSNLDPLLRATVLHLREWLAIHEGSLYDRIGSAIGWDELASAKVALNGGLQIDVPLPGYGSVLLPRRAHLHLGRSMVFAVADREAMGNGGLMGGLIGSAIGAEYADWHVLAHGWTEAFDLARAAEDPSGLRLSEPAPEASAGSGPSSPSTIGLSETARDAPTAGGRSQPESPGKANPGETSKPAPIRPLKDVEGIRARVEIVGGPTGSTDAEAPTPANRSTGLAAPRRGKRVNIRAKGGGGKRPRSDPDRETRGLQVVAREVAKIWGAELTDVRDQDNVGADAVDDAGRFYELKAHSGGIPAEVSLEPSQFDRARGEGENFILAVVGGLAEGHETVVKLIPDPLRRLPWWTTSNIVVGGLLEPGDEAAEPGTEAA